MAHQFASNVCACTSGMVRKRPSRCVVIIASLVRHHQRNSQTFCQEAALWKHMKHPNVLPLLGITTNLFQLISIWVSHGDLLKYVKGNPNAEPVALVSVPPLVFIILTPAARCPMSPRASDTYTLTM